MCGGWCWWVVSVESLGNLGSGLFIFALWAAKALCDCTGRGRHGNARFSSCGRSELSALLRATVGDQVRPNQSPVATLNAPRLQQGDSERRSQCLWLGFFLNERSSRSVNLTAASAHNRSGSRSPGWQQPQTTTARSVQDLRAMHHQQARE